MLSAGQEAEFASALGVADAQMRLDHLLSHVLHALSRDPVSASVLLFGGTALHRTYLHDPPWTRLSEDLDLLELDQEANAAARLAGWLPAAIRRDHPDARWLVSPTQATGEQPAVLRAGAATLRVQLLRPDGGWWSWTRVPRECRDVRLRYPDVPASVRLTVPTLAGFVAMKLSAWEDREQPRDLFDLAGLASRDAYREDVLEVFRALVGRPPDRRAYKRVPDAARHAWEHQLSHQAPHVPAAETCMELVREALEAILP